MWEKIISYYANIWSELKDVFKSLKEVGNQAGDVASAVKGKKRKGRKRNGNK